MRKRVVTEEPLAGGNMTASVVRIGDRVHRTSGPAFSRRLLIYLEQVGFPYAPRYLGVDDQGRDMLTYIAGSTSDHPAQRADGAWSAAAQMLRALHDATAGSELAGDNECARHGDPGAFNVIFRDGMPIASIDWDSAGPGTRLSDLAYLAWTWCIYPEDAIPIDAQASYLRDVRTGYGDVPATTFLDEILAVQTSLEAQERSIANDDRASEKRRAHARIAAEWAASSRDVVERHRGRLLQ